MDKLELEGILKYISNNVYDYYHGFGPTTWVMDVVPFMDELARLTGMTKEDLGVELNRIRSDRSVLLESERIKNLES